ncbi:MAG TPA: hypothetical protein VFZ33_09380 [Chitinophagaceae bacterium]
MLYILSFLLSWLSGMLIIFITAFFSYDQFSMIDIVSFATMTFAGVLILFLLIYLIVLKVINNMIAGTKQFIYFPIIFSLLANLPAYFLIWKSMGDLYGSSEATLFTLSFLTSGFVFGLFWAWKNKMLSQAQRQLPKGE